MGRLFILGSAWIIFFIAVLCFPAYSAGTDPCCPLNEELRYLLHPPSEARFPYQVRHESFLSSCLGKEKNFFLVLPPDFDPRSSERYPLLILLHGYDFHRNGSGRAVCDPQVALDVLCQGAEEEYHWLLMEEIAPIAAAMMAARNKTYRNLEENLKARFEELAHYGGLGARDYRPADIATSLVEHNLHPVGGIDDPFPPIRKMVIVLPDGDNSFYTDEDEGKRLFPPTSNKGACDAFSQAECLRIRRAPRRYMRPGALGQYESYILELMKYLRTKSSLKGKLLPPPHTGIGGFSMGGFGALKIALRHPELFRSVSSQSGLVDIELLTNKIVLKSTMPEFLEVFGSLVPLGLPSSSVINEAYRRAHNPVRLINEGRKSRTALNKSGKTAPLHSTEQAGGAPLGRIRGPASGRCRKAAGLWNKIYFDYGAGERLQSIMDGNRRLEEVLGVSGRMIPVQAYNGKAGHNYYFWRSRLGNVLEHHSRWLR